MTYKADECVRHDDRGVALRSPTDDEPNEEQHITGDDEPSSSEEIRISAANPKES